MSVLTEPRASTARSSHLEKAARALLPRAVPAMRKDFLVDPYQVLEARAAGAGGVLLILRMLPTRGARGDARRGARARLFVLLEAFDEAEIDLARALLEARRGQRRRRLLVGVNCRDLRHAAGGTRPVRGAGAAAAAGRAAGGRERRRDAGGRRADGAGRLRPGAGRQRADGRRRAAAALAAAMLEAAAPRSVAGRAAACRTEPGRAMWIKICGLTTPEAVDGRARAGRRRDRLRVRASRRGGSSPQRAARARGAGARPRSPASRSCGIPSRGCCEEMLAVFAAGLAADRCATTSPALDAAGRCGVLPVVRAGAALPQPLPARLLFEGPVSGTGEPADWAAGARARRRAPNWCSPAA